MSISITWHGHACLSLNVNGFAVVVDPFFARNNPAARTRVDQVPAQYILQTHGHGDHIADTLALATRTRALIIANADICGWLGRHGYDHTHGMNIGGGYQFPCGHIKMTLALHSSGLPDGAYGGDPGGFVISTGDQRVYVAGDTALFSDMKLIGDMGLDAAVLPIGDNYTMGAEDSIAAINLLRPKVVIPYHYNTWPVISADTSAWTEMVKARTTATPVVLGIDETYTL
jgi:L-ascorbate metabolism protein UlaG (beta-lactamase superfamily)